MRSITRRIFIQRWKVHTRKSKMAGYHTRRMGFHCVVVHTRWYPMSTRTVYCVDRGGPRTRQVASRWQYWVPGHWSGGTSLVGVGAWWLLIGRISSPHSLCGIHTRQKFGRTKLPIHLELIVWNLQNNHMHFIQIGYLCPYEVPSFMFSNSLLSRSH